MNIFESLLIEQIEIFKNSYVNVSRKLFYDEYRKKLIHPGEFGTYRENIAKSFLRFFIPERLKIEQGFLINSFGEVSTQCDIIIYDANVTPLIQSGERQRFFPVETVCAIGEIKSILSKTEFAEALNKLSRAKAMREKIRNPVIIRQEKILKGKFNPENYPYDQIASFIICQKLNFSLENIPAEIGSLYEQNIPYRHRHNLILSIEDGLIHYYDANQKSMMFPCICGVNLKNRLTVPININNTYKQVVFFCFYLLLLIKLHKIALLLMPYYPSDNPYTHFKLFCSYIFMITSSATILYPEITDYMVKIAGGTKIDEDWLSSHEGLI